MKREDILKIFSAPPKAIAKAKKREEAMKRLAELQERAEKPSASYREYYEDVIFPMAETLKAMRDAEQE